jgi:uncharacterized protein DUF5663
MIKLDDDLLQELGLAALPDEEKKKLLAHIYETLEMRVGMKLAERMSDAQLTEFEQFIDRNDEAGALQWLEHNFPNYKDVVATEFETLKKEIGQVAPQILATSQQQVAPGGQPQPMGPMNPMGSAAPVQPPYGAPAPVQPAQPMWQGDQATGTPDPWQMPPQQPMPGGPAPVPAGPMPQQPFPPQPQPPMPPAPGQPMPGTPMPGQPGVPMPGPGMPPGQGPAMPQPGQGQGQSGQAQDDYSQPA